MSEIDRSGHIKQTSNGVKLGGIQKTTLIDFPGRIAATIFLIGCNFRCPFCYSAELVLPDKIKTHPKISEKYFFDFLKKRKGLLEGVCLTGGEPTLNKDLPQFIKKIRKLGFLIKLDTNGSNPKMLKKLIGGKLAKRDSLSSLTSLPQSGSSLIDYVAMDIKAPLNAKNYNKATGIKNDLKKIKKSIEIIKKSGLDYEFRTTVVPGIHIEKDIIQIAKDISPAKRYYLQNFRPEKTLDPDFVKIKPYSKEYLSEIQKTIAPFFEICQIR